MADQEPGAGERRLTLPERLALVYQRLDQLPPASSAQEALDQLNTTLEQVEDEFSGVPKDPNPGLAFDGRMYPPREDFTARHPDGSITARTKGNTIFASPDGALRITSRRSGEEVYRKASQEETEAAQVASLGFSGSPAERLTEGLESDDQPDQQAQDSARRRSHPSQSTDPGLER